MTDEPQKEITKIEFIELCQKYAGEPDSSMQRWEQFFAMYPRDWTFQIYGEATPKAPRDRLSIVTDFAVNEIRTFFSSEEEEDQLYDYPGKK